ncbi:hypothetical protein LZ30DRAFT_194596 [Colletotrichum cereale]|nr:hypothetical protein LZ30DRAFT_194596 [Colletotrichum cereale]
MRVRAPVPRFSLLAFFGVVVGNQSPCRRDGHRGPCNGARLSGDEFVNGDRLPFCLHHASHSQSAGWFGPVSHPSSSTLDGRGGSATPTNRQTSTFVGRRSRGGETSPSGFPLIIRAISPFAF